MPNDPYVIEVDRSTGTEWEGNLAKFRDANVYQTWAYGAVRWSEEKLSHLVLRRDREVVAMAQVRILRVRGLKLGVAYLKWGPMCHREGQELDPEVIGTFAAALRTEYALNRGLCLWMTPNAFRDSQRAGVIKDAFSTAGFDLKSNDNVYRTLVVDLSPTVEDLRKRLDQKWRNRLNRAEKNGLAVEEAGTIEAYRTFSDLYRGMWARKRFRNTVSMEEYGRIQEALPLSQRMRILTCYYEGAPVGGLVYSAIGDTGLLMFAATNETGMELQAATLLQWHLVRHLKGCGMRYYDLGGIDPVGNPGVYHFKDGLAGRDQSHLGSFVACQNALSRAVLTAALILHRRLRH